MHLGFLHVSSWLDYIFSLKKYCHVFLSLTHSLNPFTFSLCFQSSMEPHALKGHKRFSSSKIQSFLQRWLLLSTISLSSCLWLCGTVLFLPFTLSILLPFESPSYTVFTSRYFPKGCPWPWLYSPLSPRHLFLSHPYYLPRRDI